MCAYSDTININYSLIAFSLLIKLFKSVEEYKFGGSEFHSLIAVGRKEW